MRKINLIIKRCVDIIGSGVAIVILMPLFVVVSFLIKIDSSGPVFFCQNRLGKNGKIFKIVKFRTMVINSENIGDGLRISSENDPRITKIGKLLRAYSLDELPQLFNIFVGDMSAIGPRPPVIYHPYNGYENYPEWARKRFEMRPGLSGYTQVKVRASVPWDERIKFDNEYVDKFNIFFDLKILFWTFIRVVKSDDLYLTPKETIQK